jgi:hypothetical protein
MLTLLPLVAPAAARAQGQPSTVPAEAPPKEEPKPLAGYDKGFFLRSADDKFRLGLGAWMQARFTYHGLEDETDEYAFSIPRIRLVTQGHVFTKDLRFKIETDFGQGSVTLKDGYVDLGPHKYVRFRVGQHKRPFSRQQMGSDSRKAFLENALTDKEFGGGRDLGVTIHDDYDKSPTFEYAVGVFNGQTADKPVFQLDKKDDKKSKFINFPKRPNPALVARVGLNLATGDAKVTGYDEQADFDGGAPRISVALGNKTNFNVDRDDKGDVAMSFDYLVKLYGLTTTGGAYLQFDQDGDTFSDLSYAKTGFHVQAGYLIAKRVQPAVRYARIIPRGGDGEAQEILGGLTVFIYERHLAWGSDSGLLLTEQPGGGKDTDWIARTQLQLAF